ncbi:MAG: VanZ family protein [Erysipelothrix sp.]|nr:VanZ family protein [Erysipelothrix sp.]
MTTYTEPIMIATLIFPIITLFLTFPIALIQYRRKGSLSFFYSFLTFSFIYYLLAAYFLVILPLPNIQDVNTTYSEMMQLIPFQFVLDIIRETNLNPLNPKSYLPALIQPVILQVIFNIILTIPFGMYLRYFFKRTFKQAVFIALGLALFFELSQLSGLFFMYPGPYRLFDVDDLILNTSGSLIGFASVPLFGRLLPKTENIDSKLRARADRISILKRWVHSV